ncbi:MAG: hypothetical protein ACEQSA_06070 [Weeksellaceae bacterium]
MHKLIGKLSKKLLIPLMLFTVGAVLIGQSVLESDYSFSTLSYNHSVNITNNKPLLAGDTVQFSIQAKENNLGIVLIEFDAFNRFNKDTVQVKIKEKNAKTWHHSSKIPATHFTYLPLYPFGFPNIKDSQNQIYTVEIKSLEGAKDNAIAISPNPTIQTKYHFSKEAITQDPQTFIWFGLKKVLNTFLYYDIFYSSLVYMFPFLSYVGFTSYFKKKLLKNINLFNETIHKKSVIAQFHAHLKYIIETDIIFFLVLIFLEIFFIKNVQNPIYLLILSLWLLNLKKHHISVQTSFMMISVFLSFSLLLNIVAQPKFAEKTAIWSYLFIITLVTQLLVKQYDIRKLKRNHA